MPVSVVKMIAAKMEVKRLISPEVLRQFGCGHRKLNDVLFKTDPALPRLGVRDLDDEELCHEVISSTCNIPGCGFTADSLLDCSQCKKVLPSPHLLDLHLQEQHDSFFAKKCKEKFMNAKERLQHCVDAHKMPKDFRFDHKPKPKKAKNKNKKQTEENLMDLHGVPEQKQFYFNNKKHKTFAKYTGKKFTTDKENSSSATDVNMDEVAAKMEVERLISPEMLRQFGCGRRKLNDVLFKTDPALPRLGVRDLDDEELCHEVISSTCNIPGCGFTADSLLDCSQCKKVLPSPHLLDLHLQEQHDSFFAVLATRKPSYCCYIEECKEKFMNAKERLQHCVDAHKMPKDFRFDHKPKPKKAKNKNKKQTEENLMDLDGVPEQKQFYFNNTKHKTFAKYTGKK
ncbi:hypothetical protein MSG28_005955, partial [Choristoneura fumiferana]